MGSPCGCALERSAVYPSAGPRSVQRGAGPVQRALGPAARGRRGLGGGLGGLEARLPAGTRARLRRSRSIRRWETELRDGLRLCADGRWKEGSLLLLRRTFDLRLPTALIVRPDIFFRVIIAAVRRLPQWLRDTTRRAVRGTAHSRKPEPSDFEDPLGEYDLWDRPRPGSA